MDITVYLPDALGQKAKEAEVNFSGLLRAAVIEKLERREAIEQALSKVETYELELEDREGRGYIGMLEGTMLCECAGGGGTVEGGVYIRASDEAVIVHDSNAGKFWVVEDPETELRDSLLEEDYIEVMHGLGITPKIGI